VAASPARGVESGAAGSGGVLPVRGVRADGRRVRFSAARGLADAGIECPPGVSYQKLWAPIV